MPEEYYPTTPLSVLVGFLMCFPLWIMLSLFSWGVIVWGLKYPTVLGWTNFGVFLGYLAFLLIIIYFGSADRKKIER